MLDTIFLCEKKQFLLKYIDEALTKMFPILLPPLLHLKLRAQDQKNSVIKKRSKGNVEQHL